MWHYPRDTPGHSGPKAGTRSYLRHRLNKACLELEVSFLQNSSLAQKANETGGQTQKSHLVETLLQCFQQDSLDEWSAARNDEASHRQPVAHRQ